MAEDPRDETGTIRMSPMSVRRRRTISIGVLLVGYSALLAGLFGLTAKPLLGVLLVLGGMALSICSAAELVQDHPETSPDSPETSQSQ